MHIDKDPDTNRFSCDVVVIDDYQLLTDQVANALRKAGMVVQSALDGHSALALAAQCGTRVAIVDCALPDMDGLVLIPQLRSYWPDAIIIVISGQVGGMSEAAARRIGVHAFLNKPVPLNLLCRAVERLVRAHASGQKAGGAPHSWLALGLGSQREDDGVIRLLT